MMALYNNRKSCCAKQIRCSHLPLIPMLSDSSVLFETQLRENNITPV